MGKNGGGALGSAPSRAGPECCMCGDYGLSSELFKCLHCEFRSQHKYCSNMYPQTVSCDMCNWCLSQKGVGDTKTCHNYSSQKTSDHQAEDIKLNKKKRVLEDNQYPGGLKDMKKHRDKINKQNEFRADRPGPSAGMKRVTTDHGGKKIIRRTKSEEISNGGGMIIKQVMFRNKVRRYKLLDEVSC